MSVVFVLGFFVVVFLVILAIIFAVVAFLVNTKKSKNVVQNTFCTGCGAIVNVNSKFCDKCGKEL